VALLAGCAARPAPTPTATPTPDLAAECCRQCVDATKSDPSGQDLSMLACSEYASEQINGRPALTLSCIDWFDTNPKRVLDCR